LEISTPGRDAGHPAIASNRPRPGPAFWLRLAGLGVVTTLALVAFRTIAWGQVIEVLEGASPLWIGVAVLSNAAILVLWAIQWKGFLAASNRDVPFPTVFRTIAVTSTVANGGIPLSGPATGAHLLATRGGVGHAAGFSVVALDQLAEGTAKVVLLLLVAAAAPLPDWMRAAIGGVTLAVALLATALIVAAHRIPEPGADARPPPGAPLRERAVDFLVRFSHNLDTLRSVSGVARALVLSLGMKAAELGGILAVSMALGGPTSLAAGLTVLAAVALATMVPVSPGNLGVYEGAAFAAWHLAGADPATATALALIQHAAFLLPASGIGLLVLTRRPTSD
jgi:uncharacterized protein (TIRG00374 family)